MSTKATTRRSGPWRIYGRKYPTNIDGTLYSGDAEAENHNAWFWVRNRREMSLYIRVQGRKRAAAVARLLNLAERTLRDAQP